MTPCYCANCKKELPICRISDAESAWCPRCKRIVDMSCFQVPGWIVGIVVMLTTWSLLPVV